MSLKLHMPPQLVNVSYAIQLSVINCNNIKDFLHLLVNYKWKIVETSLGVVPNS